MIPERVDVLGVPVDAINRIGAHDRIREMLTGTKTHLVFAVNPEKVIRAQNDTALLEALRGADLLIPDGIGVVVAARLLHRSRIERVPGSELMPDICQISAGLGYSIFLYGARPEIVGHAAKILESSYPALHVAGIQHGYVPEDEMDDLIARINASRAAVLFVATGSPRQELWMTRYRERLKVRICQGVGGTFDALCGHPKRAPELVRRVHAEWLYRLITQPHRASRQSALPRFALQVLREITNKKDPL